MTFGTLLWLFGLCSLVLGLLSWCTVLRLVSVLFFVPGLLCWCTALRFVSVPFCNAFVLFCFVVCLVFVCCGNGNFCLKVGRVRFPGDFGELAPFGGTPYLRWTHCVGLALYPRFG